MSTGIAGLVESTKEDFQNLGFDYRQGEYSANYANAYFQRIYPLVPSITDQENCLHTFEIGSLKDSHFIDLQNIYADIKFKVVHSDGTDLVADERVSIVNNISHNLFRSIDTSINQTLVSDHGRYNNFRSYVTNALSLSSSVKVESLISDCWLDDEDDATVDVTDAQFTDAKTSINIRSAWISESKERHLYFKPHFDLATSPRFLPPSTVLKLDFTMADSKYLLLATKPTHPNPNMDYRLKIVSFVLEVGRILPSPEIITNVVSNSKPYNFPITRTTVRRFQINAGEHEVLINRIVNPTQLPYQLIVIPIQNTQFSDINKNPLVFSPHGIVKANLILNGSVLPANPYQIGSGEMRTYKLCQKVLGFTETGEKSNGITRYAYPRSKFYLAWDLTNCW